MTKDEALRLALEALKSKDGWGSSVRDAKEKAIAACEAALEAKDEPVATDWERIARVQNAKLMAMCDEAGGFEKLCEVMDKYEATTPPQQEAKDEPVACCNGYYKQGYEAGFSGQQHYIHALQEALAKQEQGEPVACKETDELECPICKVKAYPYPKCGHVKYVDEQEKFENWLTRNCPSGDAESVQRQWESSSDYADLYTTPPQRTWVGLTDEDVYPLANEHLHYQTEGYEVSGIYNFARAIEAKLQEKNNG